MCIVYNFIHPSCGHQAIGTAGTSSDTRMCANWFACSRLDERDVSIGREYCDMCIITGITVAKAKVLDMQAYASSMGVSVNDMMNAYPQWRPW